MAFVLGCDSGFVFLLSPFFPRRQVVETDYFIVQRVREIPHIMEVYVCFAKALQGLACVHLIKGNVAILKTLCFSFGHL